MKDKSHSKYHHKRIKESQKMFDRVFLGKGNAALEQWCKKNFLKPVQNGTWSIFLDNQLLFKVKMPSFICENEIDAGWSLTNNYGYLTSTGNVRVFDAILVPSLTQIQQDESATTSIFQHAVPNSFEYVHYNGDVNSAPDMTQYYSSEIMMLQRTTYDSSTWLVLVNGKAISPEENYASARELNFKATNGQVLKLVWTSDIDA